MVVALLPSCACKYKTQSEQKSPSGEFIATVTEISCGAPGGISTAVNVRKATRSFSPKEGIVVGVDAIALVMTAWKDDDTLIVYLPRSASRDFASNKVGPKRSEVNGVHIEYR